MNMSKKKKFSYLTFIIVLALGVSALKMGQLQADILRILDVRSYTVKNVSYNIGDKNAKELSAVSGYVFKDKDQIERPYVIVIVDFYKNGKVVDSKSTTIETQSLRAGDKRKFEVMTDVTFDEYKYHLE